MPVLQPIDIVALGGVFIIWTVAWMIHRLPMQDATDLAPADTPEWTADAADLFRFWTRVH